MAKTPTRKGSTPGTKPTYPHVPQIKDRDIQQTTRLLWDQVYDLKQKLVEGNDSFTAQINSVKDIIGQKEKDLLLKINRAKQAANTPYTRTTTGGGSSGGGSGGSGGGGDVPNHLDVVVAARATYDAYSGVERAGRITNQVAWDLRGEGFGLLFKDGGTNWMERSIDVVVRSPNGESFDILGDADGQAIPQWGRTSPKGFSDMSKWRAPVDPSSI